MNEDSEELYLALEDMVSLYYKVNNQGKVELSSDWIDRMIECICVAGYFNTYRMLDQYKQQIWKLV
jgi:glucan phosphorylase